MKLAMWYTIGVEGMREVDNEPSGEFFSSPQDKSNKGKLKMNETYVANIVCQSINGMTHEDLKNEVKYHLTYVPGTNEMCEDGGYNRQAISIFKKIFCNRYKKIVGEDCEHLLSLSFCGYDDIAIERIKNILMSIKVRMVYKGVNDENGDDGLFSIDNITFKQNPIHIEDGYKLSEHVDEFIKEYSDEVEFLIMDKYFEMELGIK